MLQYFKRYNIYVAIVAVVLPMVASTVWPLATGQMMASSIGGLVGLFVLFAIGLFVGYAIFGRRADAETEKYLASYNDDCDPQALVESGAKLAAAIPTPCDQSGSWFLGYYAQALLDLGRTDQAMAILAGLKASMQAAKTPSGKVGILVNVLPLAEKAEGPKVALELADEGVELCRQAGDAGAAQMRDYLESQQKVLRAELSDDPADIAKLAGGIAGSDRYPMRIRVEYAWREASAQYKLDDLAEEKRSLEFVAKNGGKLALAQKAAERLAKLG